jgi:iron complex transport system substrate-binding protein
MPALRSGGNSESAERGRPRQQGESGNRNGAKVVALIYCYTNTLRRLPRVAFFQKAAVIRRCTIVLLALFPLLMRTAPSWGAEASAGVRAVDDRGKVVGLPQPARRVISLAPNVTEILYAIGLDREIAGVLAFSNYPEEAKTKPVVGSGTLDYEKILSLRPDLVVGVTGFHPAQDLERLESLGLTLYVMKPTDLESIFRTMENLGRLTGKGDSARRACDSLRERVAKVESRVSGLAKTPVLLLIWPDPPMVPGKESFLVDLTRRAGGLPLLSGFPGESVRISMEVILQAKPQVLVLPDLPESRRTLTENDIWTHLPAVVNNRILWLNPDRMHRPGPRLVDALEKLAAFLHP